MRIILLLFFIVPTCFGSATTPLLQHDDSSNEREFQNVYQTIDKSITTSKNGVTDGSNASSGQIGEYVSALNPNSPSADNCPASGNFGDLSSISLTAGDWSVSVMGQGQAGTSTPTDFSIGISSTSGNASDGLVIGNNRNFLQFNGASNVWGSIPNYRVSLTTTKTYYLKYRCSYSGGVANALGRISAIRIR